MTYKQAAAAGAQVRKGEKGSLVQYWKFDDEQTLKDAQGKPIKDAEGNTMKVRVELERPHARREQRVAVEVAPDEAQPVDARRVAPDGGAVTGLCGGAVTGLCGGPAKKWGLAGRAVLGLAGRAVLGRRCIINGARAGGPARLQSSTVTHEVWVSRSIGTRHAVAPVARDGAPHVLPVDRWRRRRCSPLIARLGIAETGHASHS